MVRLFIALLTCASPAQAVNMQARQTLSLFGSKKADTTKIRKIAEQYQDGTEKLLTDAYVLDSEGFAKMVGESLEKNEIVSRRKKDYHKAYACLSKWDPKEQKFGIWGFWNSFDFRKCNPDSIAKYKNILTNWSNKVIDKLYFKLIHLSEDTKNKLVKKREMTPVDSEQNEKPPDYSQSAAEDEE